MLPEISSVNNDGLSIPAVDRHGNQVDVQRDPRRHHYPLIPQDLLVLPNYDDDGKEASSAALKDPHSSNTVKHRRHSHRVHADKSSSKNHNGGSGGEAITNMSTQPFDTHERARPTDLSSDEDSLPSPFKKLKYGNSPRLSLGTAARNRKRRERASHRDPHRHSSKLASETSSKAHRQERHHGLSHGHSHGHSHGRSSENSHGHRHTPSKDRLSYVQGSRVEKPRQKANLSRLPPRPNLVDKLVEEARGRIEYVKGVGITRVEDPIDLPSYDLQPKSKELQMKDSTFRLQSVSTRQRFIDTMTELKWTTKSDSFVIKFGGRDEITIDAKNVLSVSYELGDRMFHFKLRDDRLSRGGVVIQVEDKVADVYGLRGLMEKRFGAVKVDKVETAYFDLLSNQLSHSRLNFLPPTSTDLDSTNFDVTVGSDDPVLAELSSVVNGAIQRTNTHGALSQENGESIEGLKVPPSIHDNVSTSFSVQENNNECNNNVSLHIEELRYPSGQIIHPNDLVIRLRDPKKIPARYEKLNDFDGPWEILTLSGWTSPDDCMDQDNQTHKCLLNPPHKGCIKLDFPEASAAQDTCTCISRLRPAYEVSRIDDDEKDIKKRYLAAKALSEKTPLEDTDDVTASRSLDEKLYAFHLKDDVYMTVPYIAPEGKDGKWEIGKVIGKRVYPFRPEDLPDEEVEDDPIIGKFFEGRGRRYHGNMVLVVQYRVHWAGWPAEDDSWERAQDNIPQGFVDQFIATTVPHDEKIMADLVKDVARFKAANR